MNKSLIEQITLLPRCPGVYIFKDDQQVPLYVGKAKDLKNRVSSYIKTRTTDIKSARILEQSVTVEYRITATELAAMVLEARLIQNYQPRLNVLLKEGQPFLYFMVTGGELPELKLVRNKRHKGSYIGPFIEKGSVRSVYSFLLTTFRLKVCHRKMKNGCLYYHLGTCAGSCRDDFDINAYKERLDLAVKSIKQGHKKFLNYLKSSVDTCNQNLEFEKSRETVRYIDAFSRLFSSLDNRLLGEQDARSLTEKDIWIIMPEQALLVLFKERDGVVKQKKVWHTFMPHDNEEYMLSYYRSYEAPSTIITNFESTDKELIEQFLSVWRTVEEGDESDDTALLHDKRCTLVIKPEDGHFANLLRLATVHALQEHERHLSGPASLQRFLHLSKPIHTIDCFDISHKQGTFMVGSCIRFKDGEPDKAHFRRFHITTVVGQDDYASLREIVSRRYRQGDEPDLILIDGGKGQLNAVKDLVSTHIVSLAKREETVFSQEFPQGKKISVQTYTGQLLIALRDYAHHFAITFHRSLAEKDIHEK